VGRFDDPDCCSREDARELARQGMIVGLHGRNHVNWRNLDDAGLADETVTARAELADALGQPVSEVAIPFGSYDRRVIAWLRAQGFERIHTSDGGTFRPAAAVWDRNTLRSDMAEDEVTDILLARESAASYWRRQAKRLLFRFAA
jgi:peptidoglycan/xylan/chitin deacetylase (PgdA/CDA1 family)